MDPKSTVVGLSGDEGLAVAGRMRDCVSLCLSRRAAAEGSGAMSDSNGAAEDRAGEAAAESAAQEQRRDPDGAATTWEALQPLSGGHDRDSGSGGDGAGSGRQVGRLDGNGSMFASRKVSI